jgi:hypothetical protein
LGLSAWRLRESLPAISVAAISCQSSLGVAIGEFWKIWGRRRGGFETAGDFWRSWAVGVETLELPAISGEVEAVG